MIINNFELKITRKFNNCAMQIDRDLTKNVEAESLNATFDSIDLGN